MLIQFDQYKIKEIIQNLNLSDIVQAEGIQLQNAGANREKCPCPLHEEKTASFFIYNQKSFHCFGCGAGGDAISFIRQYHGLSFPDALKYAGIQPGKISREPALSAEIIEARKKKRRIQKFYHWLDGYISHLSESIYVARWIKKNITPEIFEDAAYVLQRLSIWEYHLELLTTGSDFERVRVYKDLGGKI